MSVTAVRPTQRGRTTSAAKRDFRADIQGMRAIAVLLVMLYHAGVPLFRGGYVGVDVFFVISGFLITSHLASALRRDGRIRFADFYARRIRRILPASFAVVVVTAVSIAIWYPIVSAPRALQDAVATLLYAPNFWFAWKETDYLADHEPSAFQHYWSLGIEEQFYLLWPLVLFVLFVLLRRKMSLLAIVVACLALGSFAWGVMLTPRDPSAAFFMLHTRAWELMIGGLVAFAAPLAGVIPQLVRAVLGWIGLAAVIGSAIAFDEYVAFPGWAAAVPVVGAALIIAGGIGTPRGGPGALLSVRPAQHLGTLSYSLYLVHWPLLIVPQAAVGYIDPLPQWATLTLGLPVAYLAALLLHHLVEEPLRAPRMLTQRPPRVTLWAALGMTVVLVSAGFTAVAWAEQREIPTGGVVAAAGALRGIPPEGTDFIPANLRPALDAAAEDVPVIYDDGCQLDTVREDVQECRYGAEDPQVRIALFGDSHSAQWFPSLEGLLAERPELAVDVFTKSSCPAIRITTLVKGTPYSSCDRWRESVLQTLTADPPDLVIMSSYSGYELVGVDAADRATSWATATESTVGALTAAGSRVLSIVDTPRFPASPVTCVTERPTAVLRCAGEREHALDAELSAVEAKAVTSAGGDVLDLTNRLCDAERCPVIIDDILVYRDVNHLTATMVLSLAPQIEEAVRELLPASSAGG